MQDTPPGMIEELRYRALEEASEAGISQEETLAWEAADMLQEFLDALRAVARGEMDAAAVRDMLDPVKRMTRAASEPRRG